MKANEKPSHNLGTNNDRVQLTLRLMKSQYRQIEAVNDILCHPTVNETIRYLITRGLQEQGRTQALTEISDTQRRLLKAFDSPELPDLIKLLEDEAG